MIPTSTGAAKAIGLVMPELKGKLDGFAMRVPTPNVSVVDLVVELNNARRREDQRRAEGRAQGALKGILAYTTSRWSPSTSAVPRLLDRRRRLTKVLDGPLAKVIAWYDNEMGYSSRVQDLIAFMVAKG